MFGGLILRPKVSFISGNRGKDKGAAIAEAGAALCLILPVVFLILFAVLEASYAYLIKDNLTQAAHMLSTAITINSGATQASDGVIDTANDDVAAYDVLRIDVTAISTTAAKGLLVVLEFRLP